jgi:DNA ligase D-like protein (predicted 3'-phosphoesterase)
MAKFVIQEHAATSHHFDLRIEVGGVYKSWAVPKGLSLNPKDKRLAMEVEDHPLSWGRFEGVIPEGEYGAGEVIIWDRGSYKNLRDISMEKALKEGRVEVWLEGEKLRGGWLLVKYKGRKGQWLVIKLQDEGADARRNPVKTERESVKSGRTIEELRG